MIHEISDGDGVCFENLDRFERATVALDALAGFAKLRGLSGKIIGSGELLQMDVAPERDLSKSKLIK